MLSFGAKNKKHILVITSADQPIEIISSEAYKVKTIVGDKKTFLPLFKILNDKTYDLSICNEEDNERSKAKIASYNCAIISKKLFEGFRWNILKSKDDQNKFIKQHENRKKNSLILSDLKDEETIKLLLNTR